MPVRNEQTNDKGLTARQSQFCHEFSKDSNVKAACLRMGLTGPSAGTMGYELLKRPQVIQEIARLRERLVVRTGKSLEEIVARVETIGFAEANSLIAHTSDHVKNADRLKALELLLRLKGAFTEKVEVTGKDGGPITTVQLSWVAMITKERDKIKGVPFLNGNPFVEDVPFVELPQSSADVQDAKESSDAT